MKPIKFKDANKLLTRPHSMTDKECGPLSVWTDGEECMSCWKPSLRERLSVLLFGRVWLSVLSGETQPPVVIWAAKEAIK